MVSYQLNNNIGLLLEIITIHHLGKHLNSIEYILKKTSQVNSQGQSSDRRSFRNLSLAGKIAGKISPTQIRNNIMKIANFTGKLIVMKNFRFTAEITRDNEIKQYIGIVPGLPGAHTQAPTLDELYQNLQDVVQLCVQEMTDEEIKDLPDYL